MYQRDNYDYWIFVGFRTRQKMEESQSCCSDEPVEKMICTSTHDYDWWIFAPHRTCWVCIKCANFSLTHTRELCIWQSANLAQTIRFWLDFSMLLKSIQCHSLNMLDIFFPLGAVVWIIIIISSVFVSVCVLFSSFCVDNCRFTLIEFIQVKKKVNAWAWGDQ